MSLKLGTFVRLTRWASGDPIWWRVDDLGPLLQIPARSEELGTAGPDRPATVVRQRGTSYTEWVRETPEEILEAIDCDIVAPEVRSIGQELGELAKDDHVWLAPQLTLVRLAREMVRVEDENGGQP